MNTSHTQNPKTPTIQALVFDMDGLIFDSERVVRRSWDVAGKELGFGAIGTDHIFHTLGFNVVRREQYFKKHYGQDFPMDRFNDITRAAFRDIVADEGLGMKPGVRELLALAKDLGLMTAVATSSRQVYSMELLQDAGIWDYFSGAIFGDLVTHAKPDPEIYLKAAKIIGIEPQYCIALEDSPAGIQSSHAAGMYPIMIPDLVQPTEEIQKLCWKIYDSLTDVVTLLKEIQRL